jgi:hypothetical protein
MTTPGGPDFGEWRPMTTAPKDGRWVRLLVRASEQGSAEVDVARWGRSEEAKLWCWVAADSDRGCVIFYSEAEVASWAPLP